MTDEPGAFETCSRWRLCSGTCLRALREGVWARNPVAIETLGICSALAVTNRLDKSLVMGGAVIFVAVASSLLVSLLRRLIPPRVRLIAEITIIATFVILFDRVLKWQYAQMSRQLGPYVGLIITNCVVMARAETFALRHRPGAAMLDALSYGLGYAVVLAIIGLVRELLATGELMGWVVLSGDWFVPWGLAAKAPGAFFAMAVLIAAANAFRKSPAKERAL